jgi:MFS family permease
VTVLDVAGVQRRTLRLLFVTQVVGGMGVSIGLSVGALLAARLGGAGISGLVMSAGVVGTALLAVPVTRLTNARGRRWGLTAGYVTGGLGGVVVVVAAALDATPLLFVGMVLFGGGNTANLQARYAAVDLAEPAHRGRHLSVIVWATTIGAVAAPNLAPLADSTVRWTGVPVLSGPFLFSGLAFGCSAAVLALLLRPDPLLTARRAADVVPAAHRVGFRPALRAVAERPAARLGVAAVAVGHLVMVAVMVMTPVRLGESHSDADVLRVVGIVLSLHIAGMTALAPLVGWLTDRLGPRAVVLGGIGLLVVACVTAGTAGHDTPRLAVGLTLLGLGWSCTMVAGSTLLSESVPVEVRPSAQGLSDLVMGLAGASAGALSGFVVELSGYATLTTLAAIATVPLVALALRPVAVARGV